MYQAVHFAQGFFCFGRRSTESNWICAFGQYGTDVVAVYKVYTRAEPIYSESSCWEHQAEWRASLASQGVQSSVYFPRLRSAWRNAE